MKKEILRKWMLPVGAIALATLPFVSVISCSNNNGGGKPENPGGGDGGGATPEPTPTKEILNHSNTFNYPRQDGTVYLPKLLLDFDSWKQKILNNQIKWFNDDGSAIIYEVNIKIEPGLINARNEYVDVNVQQKLEPALGSLFPENYWKQINSEINLKWEFWKKENNDSNKITDFGSRVKSESPFGDGVFKDANDAQMYFALPIDQNIAVANAKGKDLENSTLDRIAWLGIDMTLGGSAKNQIVLSIISQGDDNPNNPWRTLKDKFNPIDGINTNLIVQGLPQSTNEWDGNGNYFSNVKGTLTIKPKQN